MKENVYKYFINLDKYKEGNKPIDLGGFSPVRTKVTSIYWEYNRNNLGRDLGL